jgi:Kef-type K+ transport system membrane component KefB
MNVVLALSLIFLGGFLAAKLFRTAKIPAVTSYILLGIAIGPSGLGIIPEGILAASGFISDVVLGLIAFSIGRYFSFDHFKQIGKPVMYISIMAALAPLCLVILGMFFFLNEPLYLAILFGAISTATAPAATLLVVEETKAKGPLAETLVGVVAIDDAWGLIIFAISLMAAKAIVVEESTGFQLIVITGLALAEILASLAIGIAFAVILHHYSRKVVDPSDLEILTLGVMLLTVGAATHFDLSVLLSCMALGAALININPQGFKLFDSIHPIDTPLYLIFFVLSGALLELNMLKEIGLLGTAYIFFRVVGKVGGSYLGGKISGAKDTVKRYIGLGLLPQAGVALGVALIARDQLPQAGDLIFSTIVATTVIFELFGPLATRTALELAGEVT